MSPPSGLSWRQVGHALGLSARAAHYHWTSYTAGRRASARIGALIAELEATPTAEKVDEMRRRLVVAAGPPISGLTLRELYGDSW